MAGGYTQGGGHSAASSKFGLAADQTLEFEVVDGRGIHMTASRYENSDLFWALSGGGGGTYGVVLSMTAKAHPDMPTSGFNLTFTSQNLEADTYWEAVSAYHEALPALTEAGVTGITYLFNFSFSASPLVGIGISSSEMSALVAPLLSTLEKLNVTYHGGVYQFPTYLDMFNSMMGAKPVNVAQYGSRLIPRSLVVNDNAGLMAAYRAITDQGGLLGNVAINVSSAVAGNVHNAVLPQWRDTLLHTIVLT